MRDRAPDLFEWVMAYLMLVVGVHVFFMPAAIPISHMRLILELASAEVIGLVCFCVGAMRLVALGYRSHHVGIRLACAFLSAMLWGEMVFDFALRVWRERSAVPPGLDMLTAQLVGEIVVFWRLAWSR